jgi:NAD(P)-dependent dehydrogenase (short-subunit alcohol dehydrogenase family)
MGAELVAKSTRLATVNADETGYSASDVGISALMRVMARRYATSGIRVN